MNANQKRGVVVALVAAVVALAACGDGPESAEGDAGGGYAPTIDPTTFVADVDNPFLPLPVGATWTYEVTTAEGAVDLLEMSVTDESRTVMGVETTVVLVTLMVDGELEEATRSWYAQHDDGAVWLFGEIDESYESGALVEMTTWEAGIDGALPGIAMPGELAPGSEYRVGYVAGVMEEWGLVADAGGSVSVPAGEYEELRTIENWSDLEPEVVERKHYAPGIGLVFQDSDHPDADTIVLADTTGSSILGSRLVNNLEPTELLRDE